LALDVGSKRTTGRLNSKPAVIKVTTNKIQNERFILLYYKEEQ
jgi:hypothetical protein